MKRQLVLGLFVLGLAVTGALVGPKRDGNPPPPFPPQPSYSTSATA